LFSFRYHAISLVAVFLALGIGVLLGVSIGEEGIVSNARKDLENSLRGDLDDARSRNSELRRELQIRDDFEREGYPGLVGNLMPGFRIGIVAIGDLPSGYAPAVREAIQPAGAEVDSISVIRAPLPLDRLSTALKGTRLARVDRDSDTLARFGKRLGRQLANGGSLVERVRRDVFSSSRGDYRGLDGIVWIRDREGLKGDEKAAEDRLETGVIEGMRSTKVEVVGIEMRDSDPSQVPLMKEQGLTTVDDLDLVAGQAALVYALLGADGQFGVKESADQLLPPPPTSRARR
jgi:hypothetical protein